MYKNYKYLLLIVVSFLFVGCAAEIAILNDQIKNYIPNNQTLIVNKAEENGIYLQIDKEHNMNTVRKVILSKDKRYLVSVSGEKNIIVTDIKEKKFIKKITGQLGAGSNGKFTTIALSPDNKYLVAGGSFEKNEKDKYGLIRIYDFNSLSLIKVLDNHNRIISDLDFSDDGKYLVSSDLEEKITVWNTSDFSVRNEINTDSIPYAVKIIKEKNNYKLFTIERDNHIKLYDLLSGELLKKDFVGLEINTMAIGKNEIAVGTLKYKYLEIYDFNLNKIDKINIENGSRDLSYSGDGRYLSVANAYKNAGVYIFDRYNGNNIIKNINNEIYTIKFIDNDNLLTIDNDKDFNIINIKNQKVEKIITGSKIIYTLGFAENKLAFSRNGDRYISDIKNKGYFDTYFDFEKNTIINGNIEHKIISDKNGDYALKVEVIKGFSINVPYLILMKNNVIVEKKQYNKIIFNTYGFFDNFVIAGGNRNIIYNKNFKEIALLNSNASLTMGYSRYKDLLISLNNENVMEFWDLRNLKDDELHVLYPKLSLYINENNEWVMWTPEGYFDSSENGYKYIGFHINQGYDKEAKWVGIEKLYDHFYRPDLVKLALQGEDINPYTKGLSYLDVLKNPAPEIKITKVDNKTINSNAIAYNKDEMNLEFDVSQVDNGGVGIIRIYQEGKLVKTIGEGKINRETANVADDLETQKLTLKAQKSQEEYLSKLENSVTKSMNGTINDDELIKDVEIMQTTDNSGIHKISLPLRAGENKIEIEAFNKSNTVASIREKFTVDAKIKNRKPTVYAIIAGVNEFEDNKRFSNLKYSENDAKAIGEILQTKVNEKVVSKLLLGKDFTKENLFKAVNDIKSKAKLEDKLIFYVSTHGKVFKGDLHVVPQNNKYAKDFIKFEDMFKEIQSISALDQIFVIDACESGKAKDIVSSVYDSKASVLAKQSGVHVLLATAKGTFAFEHPNPNIKHGVFTNNILDALNSKKTDENNDRKISIIELSKVLKNPEFTTEYQYPIIRNVGQDTKVRDLN